MSNKINFFVNPVSWHERAVNYVERCATSKSGRLVKQISANALTIGTGAAAGVSQIAKFIFVQPIGMALSAVVGLVRVLTWSDCLLRLYDSLTGPRDWLNTAGKIVAYILGIPVSAFAALGSFIGSKPSRLHLRYQKNFILIPPEKKKAKPAPAPKQLPQNGVPAQIVAPLVTPLVATPLPLPRTQPTPVQREATPKLPDPAPSNQQVPGPQEQMPPPFQVNAHPGVQQVPANVPVVVNQVQAVQQPQPIAQHQPLIQPQPVDQLAPQPLAAPTLPNAQTVAPPEFLEQAAIVIVPTAAAYAGLCVVGKTISALGYGAAYGASLVTSAAGGAFSLLSSAVSKAIPLAVKNVTSVTNSSVVMPLLVNGTAAVAPYLANVAVSSVKTMAQTQYPAAAPFLNGTHAFCP